MRKISLFIFLSFLIPGLALAKERKQVDLDSKVTHVQPMTGLVLCPHTAKELNKSYGESIQLEFAYCLPCKVVTKCRVDGTIEYDCYSRWFGPKIGIIEDPVCGSAHCQIIPYWAKRLGKKVINAWEASEKTGALQGEIVSDEQIIIRGKAILFAETNICNIK